jgi:hypothetical protein
MRKVRMAMAALVGVASMMLPATAALADNGDGKAACNNTEICFQMHWDNWQTSSFQRHFYNSDSDHRNDIFGNVYPEGSNSWYLASNANGLWNRDSQCGVTVYTETSYRTYYISVYRGFKGQIRSDNYSHKRCA